MQQLEPPSKSNQSLALSTDARFAALEYALEHEEAAQIVGILEPLKDLLATNKLEQLHLLIVTEQALSSLPTCLEKREDLLLGLINRLIALGYDDLLMTTFDRMSELLREQRKFEAAAVCSERSNQLRSVIFGEASNRATIKETCVSSPSSHTDKEGVIPIRIESFNSVTSLGTLLEVHRALRLGRRYFKNEQWQAAKGEFTTAIFLIDAPKATAKDGVIFQAEAESLLAACYLKTSEYEIAIPYARHAVGIYSIHRGHNTPANYRFALETLEQALSTGPEHFGELQEIRKIIASLDE